ncbi:MAG: hypothetical protein ACP5SH_15975 [Syntrophobacteraceae bacterium]
MKVKTVLPWFIALLLVFALIFLVVKQRGGRVGVYETAVRENDMVSSMRLNLLRAAEAEKSAVLAPTDEESQRFADQARVAATNVDKTRRELGRLIEKDDSTGETTRMGEFDRCWKKSENLDRLILGLAVQNTNLHATSLALTKGAAVVRDLERNLTSLIDSGGPESRNVRTVRLAYQAIVAGLKIHDLYSAHIDAETGEQMAGIEKKIEGNEQILASSLKELTSSINGSGRGAVKDATADTVELGKITKKIIALSRENTNIKSLKLSLGKKRLITAQCDDILSTLQEVIRNRGTTNATR